MRTLLIQVSYGLILVSYGCYTEGMQYDVITVGSALLDIYLKSSRFVKIPSGQFADGVALCEEFGGKTEVEQLEVTTGGGGCNNAISFARKGFKTAVIAEMGTDLIAATVKEDLTREGVDIRFLVEEQDEETGLSSIMVSKDGGRSVAVYRGASKMLTKEDIPWDSLDTAWLHVSSLGGQLDLLESLIGHARDHEIKIAVNPGSKEIEALLERGQRSKDFFAGVEVLLVNREEAARLSGVNFEDESVWKSEQGIAGPRISVITDGGNGGKVCGDTECLFYQALPVEAIEETGAGDAFGSGLVAGLMKGLSLGEAVEWGKKQAANVVQYMGAKKGLLRLDELV